MVGASHLICCLYLQGAVHLAATAPPAADFQPASDSSSYKRECTFILANLAGFVQASVPSNSGTGAGVGSVEWCVRPSVRTIRTRA